MAYQTLTLGLTLTIPTAGTRNWATTLKNTTWTKISSHDHTGGGNGAQLGNGAFADFTLHPNKIQKNFSLFQHATPMLPTGTAQTLDWDNGSVQKLSTASASGNITMTFDNPRSAGLYKLFITQGATPRTIVWPAEVKWPQGQAPILSVGSGDVDIIDFYYDGINYFGQWQVKFS